MAVSRCTPHISDFDYIMLTWIDLAGRGRGKTVPAGRLVDGDYGRAIWIDGVATKTASEMKSGRSLLMTADLSTLHPLPWISSIDYRVGEVFCTLEDPWLQSQIASCCRTASKLQLFRLSELGYALRSGFEIEFTLIDSKTKLPVFTSGRGTYLDQTIFIEHQAVMFEIEKILNETGLKVATMHTEDDDGQFEVTFSASANISSADQFYLARNAITCVSASHQLEVQFTSNHGGSGNTSNFNCSLTNNDSQLNLFWDPEKKDNLSVIAQQWMAGILYHLPALTALCNPTGSCYNRFLDTLNPHFADWDIDDRRCAIRVLNLSPSGTYFENRLPSGLANPYLVMAGTVAAGIDGLQKKMECPPKAQTQAKPVPDNLEQALEALRADQTLVQALGEDFVDLYIKKVQHESIA